MNEKISFVATGDSFITRRLPEKDENFNQISNLIGSADVRFTNLEITTHNFEGIPEAVGGGTYAIAPPKVLQELKDYNFNLMAWANNHTFDYSFGGVEATERYLDEYDFVHAGVGENLARASEPRYLETKSGRVALIAVTSTFHEKWVAGEQRPDMRGRPGINPLRHETFHIVSSEKLEQLKTIAATVGINAWNDMLVKEGFALKKEESAFHFGNHLFMEGDPEGQVTIPSERDIRRIRNSILEAKRRADFVIVSVHSHEMYMDDIEQPADFLKTFARMCIDEGVDAVIGHGPHIIRGIEIYKNCPIFYSLGNFIFQNETVSRLPSDFYEKYGLDNTHNVADAFDARTRNNTIGFTVNRSIWESIIPKWTIENGKLQEIKLYPIELGFELPRYRMGWPTMSANEKILEKLSKLSAPFGTSIEIKDGVGIVRL
jgi:poly-gamma-glutamate capsule biosynthesis protein CapA/YwtB (metallophosphatase superfamily)